MQTIFTVLGTWLPVFIMLCASPAFAQNTERTDSAQEPVAGQEVTSASYRQNREAFQAQKIALDNQVERIDTEIRLHEQALQTLAIENSKLSAATANTPSEGAGPLRSFTHATEATVVAALNPAVHYVSRLRKSQNPGTNAGSTSAQKAVSFAFPVMLILTFLLIRQKYAEFYAQYCQYLKPLFAFLIVIFPLSSLAQEVPEPLARPGPEHSFTQTLAGADEVLRLNRVQRYIKLLIDSDTKGKRVRISGVDFGDVSIQHSESVVVGSGEYYATLAALYLADGNQASAIEQLRPLALADTRYASKDTDPDRFEDLLTSSAAFLFRSGQSDLALDIIQRHMLEFRRRESFETLYPELLRSTHTTTAAELAERVIAQSSDADELLGYARILFQSGAISPATTSLKKALENVRSPALLAEIIDVSLAQEATQLVKDSANKAIEQMSDAAMAFSIAEKLSAAGWAEEPRQLLNAAITRASADTKSLVNGELVSSTDALRYISLEAFKRRFLAVAERAALAALKPLSSAERRALLMPLPADEVDPLRVPYPDKLVAPLYFGLLYEKQGRPEAAKARYQAESRRLIESLVDSNGLYVPEMMNHLTLLGSVLDSKEDAAELARLDTVLAHFEQQALKEIRALQASAVNERNTRLEQLEAQVLAARTELNALQSKLDLINEVKAGGAMSTLLLLLRNLGLIALLLFYLAGAVGLAANYALQRIAQRTSAFCWKFFETLGWIWAVSVFSAPLGLGAIVIAQYFLLNRSKNEEWLDVSRDVEAGFEDGYSRGTEVRADMGSSQAAIKAAKAEAKIASTDDSQLRNTAKEKQWENVVEMLRETRNSKVR